MLLFAHHVFFWLKHGSIKGDYANVLKALNELKNIKEVKFLHIAAPSTSDIDYEARAGCHPYFFISRSFCQ
jgi:hypothetical protein